MAGITNLAELNAVIELCGCCPAPRCCPPIIECRSEAFHALSVGFVVPDSGSGSADVPDWKSTRYLKRVAATTFDTFPATETSSYYDGGEWHDYVSRSSTGSLVRRYIEAFSQSYNVARSGIAGVCEKSDAEFTTTCELEGSFSHIYTSAVYDPVSSSWLFLTSGREDYSYAEVSGQETLAHIAWEADAAAWDLANPGGVEAWQTAKDAHDAWVAATNAHDDWAAGLAEWLDADPERVAADYPVPEPPLPGAEPPDPGAGRPAEPEAVYPPCSFQTTRTNYYYELRYVDGSPAYVLIESTAESPNPSVSVSDGIITFSTVETYDVTHQEPVTYGEWLAAVEAWCAPRANFDDAEGSSSSVCPPSDSCAAARVVGVSAGSADQSELSEVFFQFRIKLNKCCGYKNILSRWLEVFYPQEWLDWESLVLGGASNPGLEPDPGPEPTVRAWSWSGTPPLCNDSASGSSSSIIIDPYDDPSMWSPWSSVIRVPVGKFGEVSNRNYQQQCYPSGTLWDDMPEVFGEFDTGSGSASA